MKKVILFSLIFFLSFPAFAGPKLATATLRGTETSAAINPQNFNPPVFESISWSASEFDSDYFAHDFGGASPDELVLQQDGDFFLAYTIPVSSTGQRLTIRAEVFVNNVAVPGSIGESSYVRNASNHSESSCHNAVLLTGVSAGDIVEVRVRQTAALTAGTATISGQATLYASYIDPAIASVFSAYATRTVGSTDLNEPASPIQWSEDRKDVGFSHSDGINSQNINIDAAGNYLVYVNFPLNSTTIRQNVRLSVELDGVTVAGGHAAQGYIRSDAEAHDNSSLHWSGLVSTTVPNQVLTISAQQEANAGVVTVQPGKQGSIFIEQLPIKRVYSARATQLTGGSNWNPGAAQEILWENDIIIDPAYFTHSIAMNAHQITVERPGDYLLVYNDSFTSALQRPNPKIFVRLNGSALAGAEVKSHYIRNFDNHNESSGSLVFPLDSLAAGDIISVAAIQEALAGIVNDNQEALITLIYKSGNSISGTITDGINPLAGVSINGGAIGSALTDINGEYILAGIANNSAYTITPVLAGFDFVPISSSGMVTDCDLVEDFNGSLQTFSISGTILESGVPLEGVTIDGATLGMQVTDINGGYMFTNVPFNTNYNLVFTAAGCTFNPATTGAQALLMNTIHDSSADCVLPSDDEDGDGLTDSFELSIQTSLCDPDTDGDGLRDDQEFLVYKTSPTDVDSDDDGIDDGEEVALGLNPNNPDTDGDLILDGTEVGKVVPISSGTTVCSGTPFSGTDITVFIADADPSTITDANAIDTDGDGAADGIEDSNQNGRLDFSERDALAKTDGCPASFCSGECTQGDLSRTQIKIDSASQTIVSNLDRAFALRVALQRSNTCSKLGNAKKSKLRSRAASLHGRIWSDVWQGLSSIEATGCETLDGCRFQRFRDIKLSINRNAKALQKISRTILQKGCSGIEQQKSLSKFYSRFIGKIKRGLKRYPKQILLCGDL